MAQETYINTLKSHFYFNVALGKISQRIAVLKLSLLLISSVNIRFVETYVSFYNYLLIIQVIF